MNVYYTLKSGERLSMFFWDDYYPCKEVFHLPLEVTEIDMSNGSGYCYKTRKSIKYPGEMEGCTHQLKLYEDEDGTRYFIWKGEKVNIMNWDYHCLPALIEEIEYSISIKDRWFIPDDIILASLMLQADKFAVMTQPKIAIARIPGTSVCLMGDRVEEYVPYVPHFTDYRPLTNWFYKILLWPQNETFRQYCGSEEYYWSDFCSLLKSGHLKLVEIQEEEKKMVKVTDIIWDVDYEEDINNLPTEIIIPDEVAYCEDGEIDEEAISDYISDETGFCHRGFNIVES